MNYISILKKSVFVGAAILSIGVAAPLVVNAQTTRAEEARQVVEERKTNIEQTVTERKEAAQKRLTEAKMTACEKHEEKITAMMTRIADRGQKQIDLFTTISERTQQFYEDKGNVLSNYDTLVAETAAKKEAAQAAIDSVKASSAEFSCDGEDPRGAATAFKENLKLKIEALQAYRASVKDLIVGVKSVQTSESTTNTEGAN